MKKVLLSVLFMLLFADLLSAQKSSNIDDESAVVFMYHRFGESKYPSTNIRMEQFEEHLKYLAKNEYKVWPLSKLVRYIKEGKDIPKKVVVLTIDDAYKSIYTHAFARFKEYNFPFTVFVNSSPVDNGSKNYMSWDEMREMQSFGAEFANHSKTHDYMLPKEGEQSWKKRIKDEIDVAQNRLQEELGEGTNENPKVFSYPFGEYTKDTAEFIESLGYVGVTQTSGPINLYSDTKFLPRFAMAEAFGDMEGFTLKLKTLVLPIESISSIEPLVTDENPPKLTIKLKRSVKNIGCFLASGKPIPLKWNSDVEFSVQANEKLKSPRDRYTCTAMAGNGRWYWYSHFWIIK
ncbi:polysaccharide deacetylase family protein [Sulfurimonas sp.]|uniref:polysaccharide deacetylase family protein n=1 Tax=Sulfurimonas sp. TaxID=2022749 RepID=UPI0025ECF595|nr:polysaccharide deacetylase family protein [Sulfurimonas sp.]MCK9454700.1 polysaccharide deacetylase family protein [Sulfurimonas sp.]